MKKILLVLALGAALSGCTDVKGAKKALDGAGYTNIQTDGFAFLGCGQDDIYRTNFSATGPTGKHVTGTVCAGVFKGATIRTD